MTPSLALSHADPIPTRDCDALLYLPREERWKRMYRGLRLRGESIRDAMVAVLDEFLMAMEGGAA